MGKALRRSAGDGRVGWRAGPELTGATILAGLALAAGHVAAQVASLPAGAVRLDSSRFSVVAFPADAQLARSLLREAVRHDSFPGLRRPSQAVTIAIAPDARRFREWIGPSAPEWGAAIAFPESHEIVLQGSRANSTAGDPLVTLRHELAHLALHEALGDIVPRWFDEGYASFAAGEWGRDEVLATNFALILRGLPRLDSLDGLFSGGESRAQQGYALAHRAVAEMAALDPERGLTLLLQYWQETRSLDGALRRAYGVTQADFEVRWRSATRRRYGALALFADATLAALVMLFLLGPLWVSRRQRDRRRLAALRSADEAQDLRDRESALTALLGEGGAEPDSPGGKPPRAPNDDLIK